MAVLKLGVHIHQTADWNRIRAQRWSVATVLDTGDDEVYIPVLAYANPKITVILRQMSGDVRQNPVSEAEEIIHRYDMLQEWAQSNLGHKIDLYVLPTNEPIQEWYGAEPSKGAYQEIANYQFLWLKHIKTFRPDIQTLLCVDQGWFNGDGPDPLEVGYYGFDFYREAARIASGAVVHAYWNPGARELDVNDAAYWTALRMFRPKGFKHASDPGGVYHILENELAGKPYFITETNCGTDIDYTVSDQARKDAEFFIKEIIRLDTRRQVKGITWFILDTGDPQFATMKLPAWGDEYWHDKFISDPQPPPGGHIGMKPTEAEAHHIWNRYFSLRASDFTSPGYNPVTAFAKLREQHPELGMPITGEEGFGVINFKWQCFAGGVIVGEKADLNRCWVARTKAEVLAGFR